MKRKLTKHVEWRLADAIGRKDAAISREEREYWFGKATAYREILAILKGEYRLA